MTGSLENDLQDHFSNMTAKAVLERHTHKGTQF